ncbi:MAG: thioesterase domain-containing protein [Ferruginibacter sp.]
MHTNAPLSNDRFIPAKRDVVSDPFAVYFRHKGVRIKFSDIEQVILGASEVKNCAVLVEENEEEKKLVAYIISDELFVPETLSSYLKEHLPVHMVPAVYIKLQNFPLTASGEIDRAALQQPAMEQPVAVEYVAPRNALEARLSEILQNSLGREMIGIKENFFRLGGDSLQALRVISAIRRELEVALDIRYFFIYPTIEELAAHLSTLSRKDPSGESYGSFHVDQKGSFHNNPIIPIKKAVGKTPLYIVCGGGGTAFTFEKFAYMLDEDQPVYAFQHPSEVKYFQDFPETIEAIASIYVAEIFVQDPVGPYALSGHCIGGTIAFEMAKQMRAMGKKVKLLALFDTILLHKAKVAPKTFKTLYYIPNTLKNSFAKLYLKIDFETYLLRKHTKHAIQYKINSIRSLVKKVYPQKKKDHELMVFKKFEQKFELANECYPLTRYEGDMLVFYAKEHYYFVDKERGIQFKRIRLDDDTKNLWKEYARNASIYEVDGGHSTIFDPLFAKGFARLLQDHLNAAAV